MKSRQTIIIIVIAAEIIAIVFFGIKVLKKESLFGSIVFFADPVKKESIAFQASGALKHFYEPALNTVEIINPEWLPEAARETVNSDALYERFEYSIEKPENTFRIISLGDSFTQGWPVNTTENYSETLEDMLNAGSLCQTIAKFEVINLGMSGYDIEYSVERFRLRGMKYNPDLILWLLKDDDVLQINEFTLPKFDIYKAQMAASGELEASKKRGDYFPYARKASREMLEEFGEEWVLRYQAAALEKITNYHKGDILIFTMRNFFGDKKLAAVIEDFARGKSNVFFYRDAVDVHRERMAYPDWHPTPAGHMRIAQDLFSYITQNNIMRCPSPAEN